MKDEHFSAFSTKKSSHVPEKEKLIFTQCPPLSQLYVTNDLFPLARINSRHSHGTVRVRGVASMGRGRIVWGEASRKFTAQSNPPLTEVHSRDKIIKETKSMFRLRNPCFFHLNGIFQTDVQHAPVTFHSLYSCSEKIFSCGLDFHGTKWPKRNAY